MNTVNETHVTLTVKLWKEDIANSKKANNKHTVSLDYS